MPREVGKVWPGRKEFIEIELELDKSDLSTNEKYIVMRFPAPHGTCSGLAFGISPPARLLSDRFSEANVPWNFGVISR